MGIFNNSIVGTILAMMLIYALLSILVSILLEWWNQFKKTRAKHLKDSITRMIDGMEGSNLAEKLYENYMIAGQSKGDNEKPIDHISDDLFVEAFTQVLTAIKEDVTDDKPKTGTKATAAQTPIEAIKEGIDQITDNIPLKQLLLSFYLKSEGDYNKFVHQLKDWYNEFMDRVSVWYKKAQRWKLLIAGLVVSIGLNVDSIFLFNVISKNDTLRTELIKVAENVSDDYSKLDSIQQENPNELLKITQEGINQIIDSTKVVDQVVDTTKLNIYIERLEVIAGRLDTIEQNKYTQTKEALALVSDLSIPIGWKEDRAPLSWGHSVVEGTRSEDDTVLKQYIDGRNQLTFWNVVLYILGIVLTGISLSFGAPFWFELLSKLINFRKIGKTKSTK